MAELLELPPRPRHILRGDAAGAVLDGLRLPAEPCRAAEAGCRAALWLGPDEWLLLGFPAAPEGFAVVDISDRQLAYRLDGPDAATLLAAGVPLDLDAFPVGMCTRTLFDKAGITLWRIGETAWHIEVARSLAPYLREMVRAVAGAEGCE